MALMTALLAINFQSCTTDGEQRTTISYDHSVDVPHRAWRTQDTLFFPITISQEPEVRTPIVRGTEYSLWCNIRMSSDYPYTTVPMNFVVQQTDTTELGETRVTRNLLRQKVELRVRDAEGRPLGNSWGSFIQYESQVDSLTLRFDSAGQYRMLLIPAIQTDVSLKGISSVGLSL